MHMVDHQFRRPAHKKIQFEFWEQKHDWLNCCIVIQIEAFWAPDFNLCSCVFQLAVQRYLILTRTSREAIFKGLFTVVWMSCSDVLEQDNPSLPVSPPAPPQNSHSECLPSQPHIYSSSTFCSITTQPASQRDSRLLGSLGHSRLLYCRLPLCSESTLWTDLAASFI